MEAHASPGAACLPVGMTRFAAAAPGAPAMRPTYVTRRPRDVSDGEDDRDDAPPARMLFDIHACAPRDRTKADDGPQKGKDDAPEAPPQVVSDSAHLEMGRLLHRLQLDCAQPGSTPTDRMLGVCRVVLAWIATWMKPAQTVEVGALRQPGMLGYHTIRRADLHERAPPSPEGAPADACMLNYQEQSVLRTVCFADHYLHVSQRVTASMRVHVKPRVVPQGGGALLVFFDGVAAPPADPMAERRVAEEAKAAAERGEPVPAAPPAGPPLVVELGGAAFYPWPKRYHVPEDAPPCTPPPRAVHDLDFDPDTGASVGAALRETYACRLPALKVAGLTRRVPTVTPVRSAVITCQATGLEARIKFVPFRPLKEDMHNIVVGNIGTIGSSSAEQHQGTQCQQPQQQASQQLLSRRRSDEGPQVTTPSPGLGSALAALLPRRRSSLRRSLSGTSIQEAPLEELAAQQPTPRETHTSSSERTAARVAVSPGHPLTVYGVLDGKVCVSSHPLPHPPQTVIQPTGDGELPASTSAFTARAGPVADACVVYDDAVHGLTPAPTVNTRALTRNMAPALKSPSLMLQTHLWLAIVDALRTAVHERRVGAHPLTRDTLRRVLQREGPQVVAAKLKGRVGRELKAMQYAASWMLATPPTTRLPVALEHIAPVPVPAAGAEAPPAEPTPELEAATAATAAGDSGASQPGSGRSDASWDVV